MAVVDVQNISVGEKMLRLQSSLAGKALTLVKDLGYSSAAYERAKLKLEKRYGGERRQQIKQLTTLRNLPKVRSHNLQDLEEFQALQERILIIIKIQTRIKIQNSKFKIQTRSKPELISKRKANRTGCSSV